MNDYTPDKWVVIKIEGPDVPLTYKVFACWYGGYLGSNSWKLNSGITKVTKDGKFYLFEGHSGSIYKCREDNQGMHMYGNGVLNDIIQKSEEFGIKIELMPENTNWLELNYNNE
jgi:hypothetical protein